MAAPFPPEGDPGSTPGVPIGFHSYLFSFLKTPVGFKSMGVFFWKIMVYNNIKNMGVVIMDSSSNKEINEILMNEKVKGNYKVFITVKEELSAIKECIPHAFPDSKKLFEFQDGDNTIIVMKKD